MTPKTIQRNVVSLELQIELSCLSLLLFIAYNSMINLAYNDKEIDISQQNVHFKKAEK